MSLLYADGDEPIEVDGFALVDADLLEVPA
jgi:hypothetical protein